MKTAPLTFKLATRDEEFAQLHRLNHQTFAGEIPQHAPRNDGVLRDKFHDENLYFIALRGEQLVGMVALRDRRPFSLDDKLPNLNSLLPPHQRACEIRLLAVAPSERRGFVFRGLLRLLADHCAQHGHDLALISGTTRQQKLYRHLGFTSFGPVVGTDGAQFQPMYLTWQTFNAAHQPTVNLLPGPVELQPAVRRVLNAIPISHRSDEYRDLLNDTRRQLCQLTGAASVEIAVGTGTLANDIIAGQLRLLPGTGLILSNGEFGERLIDHARRAGLSFREYRVGWGESFDLEAVARQSQSCAWLWAAHCETSTGVLNDILALRLIAQNNKLHLCLDCVSSVGATHVDLADVYLASGSSGKALGAPAGLALIFISYEPQPSPDLLPRYLDLGFYAQNSHVPFTQCSLLTAALHAALECQKPEHWQQLSAQAKSLNLALRADGWKLVGQHNQESAFIVTVAVPDDLSSRKIGDYLKQKGYAARHAHQNEL